MKSLVSILVSSLLLSSVSFAAGNCSVAPFAADVLAKQQAAWGALISNSAMLNNFSVVRYTSGTTVLSQSEDQVVYDYSPALQNQVGQQVNFVTQFHDKDGSSKLTTTRSFEITGKVVNTAEGTFCQSELKHFEPELEIKSVDYWLMEKQDKVAADIASKQNLSYFYCLNQGGTEQSCSNKSTKLPQGYQLQNLLQDVTATSYKIK